MSSSISSSSNDQEASIWKDYKPAVSAPFYVQKNHHAITDNLMMMISLGLIEKVKAKEEYFGKKSQKGSHLK